MIPYLLPKMRKCNWMNLDVKWNDWLKSLISEVIEIDAQLKSDWTTLFAMFGYLFLHSFSFSGLLLLFSTTCAWDFSFHWPFRCNWCSNKVIWASFSFCRKWSCSICVVLQTVVRIMSNCFIFSPWPDISRKRDNWKVFLSHRYKQNSHDYWIKKLYIIQ